VVVLIILAIAAFLYSSGEDEPGAAGPTTATTAAPPAVPNGNGGRAAELLAELSVADESGADGYEREAFGESWGAAGDGCDVRDEVLAVESTVPVKRGDDGCTIESGRWVSIYDGYTTPDPTELEIDHMVPLAEAWASGARAWPEARRVAFANDTRHADALVAVTAATNTAKRDRDPAEWMPSARESWCRYASAWITQKYSWQLTIDAAEQRALTNILNTC
jgi:hypothetical protein